MRNVPIVERPAPATANKKGRNVKFFAANGRFARKSGNHPIRGLC